MREKRKNIARKLKKTMGNGWKNIAHDFSKSRATFSKMMGNVFQNYGQQQFIQSAISTFQ